MSRITRGDVVIAWPGIAMTRGGTGCVAASGEKRLAGAPEGCPSPKPSGPAPFRGSTSHLYRVRSWVSLPGPIRPPAVSPGSSELVQRDEEHLEHGDGFLAAKRPGAWSEHGEAAAHPLDALRGGEVHGHNWTLPEHMFASGGREPAGVRWPATPPSGEVTPQRAAARCRGLCATSPRRGPLQGTAPWRSAPRARAGRRAR